MARHPERENSIIAKTVTALQGFVGAITGNVTGNVTGDVTGNLTGNVTGNVTGGARNAVVVQSADGAITVPSVNTTYHITKAGVCAMTIVDPTVTTHDGLRLTFLSETANAHTLSNAAGSGFNSGGAASDVGTFGAAIGNGITIEARNAKWWVVPGSNLNVTLA